MSNQFFNRVKFVGNDESIAAIKSFIKSNESEFDFNKVIPMPDELNCDEEWDLSEFILTCPKVDIEKIPVSEYRVVRGFTQLPNGKEKYTIDQVDENNKIVMRDLVDYEYDGYYLIISKEELSTLRQLKSNMLKYGYPSWYSWRLLNWWSIWSAFNIQMGKDYCEFYTAPLPAIPIIFALSLRFPDVLFFYNYDSPMPGVKREGTTYCLNIKNGRLLDIPDDNPSPETIPSKGERIGETKFSFDEYVKSKWCKAAIAQKKIKKGRRYGAKAPCNLSIKDNSMIGKEAQEPLYCLHPMDYSGIILNKNNRKRYVIVK